MKILSVEKYYLITGGASRVFFETNALLERKGHQVIPFTGKYPQNFESNFAKYFVPRHTEFSDDDTIKMPLLQKIKMYFDAMYAMDVKRSIKRLVNEIKPDIAHLHTILYQISPSIISSLKKQGIPIVQTMHDFAPLCATYHCFSKGRICERCKGGKYYHILLQNCYRNNFRASFMAFSAQVIHRLFKLYPDKVDLFISPSKFLKNKMIEWGMPGEKIIHIPHFISHRKFPMSKYKSKNYFIFAGYLAKHKGIYTLLQAMRRIVNGRLKIYGRGPEKINIEKFIYNNNLKNVELCGFLNINELSKIIKDSIFCIFPSECYETFGMVILESYIVGKPVIVSDIGAYPELVIPGKTGLLFEHGNAENLSEKIKLLLENPDLCIEMGRNAREFVLENFNEELYYERLITAYQGLLEGQV